MPEVGNISARVSLDTAEFRQGIKQMSQQMAIAREEFKQATSGLDRVGNAMEIAKAKAKMLEQQIELQEKTVEQLNEQYEKAVQQYGENSRQATEYRLRLERARTSLVGMRTDLSRANQEMENLNNSTNDSSDGLGNAENASGLLSGKLSGLASMAGAAALSLAAVGAAAVAGLVIKGVTSADELTVALNHLQTQTGATDKDMSKFKEGMTRIYEANFGESFEDIAKQMSIVEQNSARLGAKSPEDIEKITTKALILRDTFEFEVNESTKASSSLVQAFGIDASYAFDLIAKGAQDGLNVSDDLIDTLNEYAPQFSALGFSADQMFTILKNGAESGAFMVDKAGDAIKEFNIRAKDGSTASAEAFKGLGLNAEEMTKKFAAGGKDAQEAFKKVATALKGIEDPVKLNTIGVGLFGTQFEDLEAKGMKALLNIEDKTVDAKGTLDKINDTRYDSFGETMTGIGRQIETNIIIPIGEKALPALNDLSKWATDQLPKFKDSLKGGFSFDFSGIYKVIDDLTNNNLGLVIAEFQKIGELVIPILKEFGDIFVQAFEKVDWEPTIQSFERFRELLVNDLLPILVPIIEAIAVALVGILGVIASVLAGVMSMIPNLIAIFGDMATISATIYNTFIMLLSGDTDKLMNMFAKASKAILDIFYQLFSGVVNFAKTFVESIIGFFSGLYDVLVGHSIIPDMCNAIIDTFTGLFNKGIEIISNMVSGITEFFTNLLNKGIEIWTNIQTSLLTIIGDIAINVINKWLEIREGITTKLSEIFSSISNKWDEIRNAISSKVGEILNTIVNIWGNIVSSISNKLEEIKSSAYNKFIEVKNNISNALSDLPSNLYNIGSNIMESLRNGIVDKISSILNKIRGLVSDIKSAFSFSLPSIGGGSFKIPGFATGVSDFRGGLARINESGGEIVNLPNGSNVIPHDLSKQIANSIGSVLGGNSNTVNVYVTLDGKELTNTISEVQYANQNSTSRRNGVTSWR